MGQSQPHVYFFSSISYYTILKIDKSIDGSNPGPQDGRKKGSTYFLQPPNNNNIFVCSNQVEPATSCTMCDSSPYELSLLFSPFCIQFRTVISGKLNKV